MVGLAYASVPLYDLFCRVTGFGGTTQVATAESDRMLDRVVTLRFDSNVKPALSWKFEPVQRSIDLQIRATGLAFYRAPNNGDETIVGAATYYVTPDKVGVYFDQIEGFCST